MQVVRHTADEWLGLACAVTHRKSLPKKLVTSRSKFHLNCHRGMKAVRQFGALVLLLMSWLAPAMACITPSVQLTHEEKACCRMMKNQCGQMGMPASHGCCQKDVQAAHHDALQTKYVNVHPESAATAHTFVALYWNPGVASAEWLERVEFSPPQSPPSSVSVLRI